MLRQSEGCCANIQIHGALPARFASRRALWKGAGAKRCEMATIIGSGGSTGVTVRWARQSSAGGCSAKRFVAATVSESLWSRMRCCQRAGLLGDEHAAAVDSFSGRRSYRAGVL